MALTTNNVIVGAGRVYTALPGVALPAFNVSGNSVKQDFDSATEWTDLGLTAEGVEIGYEPTYNDIMVDQYKDAAKVFLAQETLTVSTTIMEATLENLVFAWGRSNANINPTSGDRTFSIGIGPDQACEYSLAIVGPAPGSTLNCEDPSMDTKIERVYNMFRVISVEGSTHSLSREESTMFPVTFRALPWDGASVGEEYGTVQDRTVV